MNCTLHERVRCLLSNANLPKKFLGEVVMTASYLINRSPSTAIGLKTLMEMWTGHPPNLSNLKVFGYLAFAHSKEGKLDWKAKKCLFLGYPQGVKGYRLWCIEEDCGVSKKGKKNVSLIEILHLMKQLLLFRSPWGKNWR